MYPRLVEDLISNFETLPGVGRKSAERYVLHLLSHDEKLLEVFGDNLQRVAKEITYCPRCFFLSAGGLCDICQNSRRDSSTICVVEQPKDVVALEKLEMFKGYYHVLGGSISPMEGIGLDDLKIRELVMRLKEEIAVTELIIATNPTINGDATATYIAKLLKETGIKVSRIAYGLPVGSDLEYADELTLFRAMENRQKL